MSRARTNILRVCLVVAAAGLLGCRTPEERAERKMEREIKRMEKRLEKMEKELDKLDQNQP